MKLDNFIVFEGIDGAGTSTQLNRLKSDPRFSSWLFTAEPTSCPTGKYLRQMLKGDFEITNETAAYLFAADRNEHINGKLVTEGQNLITGVREACMQGINVVSDRYLFSSLAYQSISCPPEVPRRLNEKFPLPRLLFYFDITSDISLSRIGGRGIREIYERKDFLDKTVEQYRMILEEYSSPEKNCGMEIVMIDATRSPDEIESFIKQKILAQ